MAMLLFVIYFVWFFAQPGSFAASRLGDLVGLLLPDELLRSTLGGSAEHLQIGLMDRVPIFSAAFCWIGLGYWIGRPLTIPLMPIVSRTERNCLSTLVGLSLLSTITLLTGLAGWLHNRWLAVPVLTLCAFSYVAQRFLHRRYSDQIQDTTPGIHDELTANLSNGNLPENQTARWLWRLCQVTTIALGVGYVLSAVMPPYEFDVVEYHLQGPKEFFQEGKIEFVTHNVYLNMPLGSEMHSLAAMALIGNEDAWWSGALVGKLVIGCFSLITASLAAGFVARCFGNLAGWSSAALILAAPGNIHVAGCGLVDSVLAAYLLATAIGIHCLSRAACGEFPIAREPESQPLRRQLVSNRLLLHTLLATVSLLAGTAFACKYTGLVFVWVPAAIISGWLFLKATGPGKLVGLAKVALVFMIGLALTAGPWLAKNTVVAKNPVFPLASKWFANQAPQWSDAQAERWEHAHRVPTGPTIPGWEPTTPYGFHSLLGGLHRIMVGSSMLPPALIPLAMLGLIVGYRNMAAFKRSSQVASRPVDNVGSSFRRQLLMHPITFPGILVAWVLAVWWLGTHRIDRFWLPAIPLMAVVASLGLNWTWRHCGLRVAASLLLVCNVYGLYMGLSGSLCDQRWLVSLRSLRADQGTNDFPGRVPKTTAWINQRLPTDSKILVIGEARVFDFQPEIEYATCFNMPPGMLGLAGRTTIEQRDWLARNGVTHLLVHWREIVRYRSTGNYGFASWPGRLDIEELVRSDVARPADDWPFEQNEALLLEVNQK